MAQSELDSFYFKFNNLIHAEKYATLTFKSESGRVVVTLCVDLGHVLPVPGHQVRPRNGPARQRRRERRAANRQDAAEEAASLDKDAEKPNDAKTAAKVATKDKIVAEEANEVPANKATDVKIAEEATAVKTAEEAVHFRAAESKSLLSPIPQIDGVGDVEAQQEEEKAIFTFISDFCEEDILYSLDEIFLDSMVTTLVKRVRSTPLSAEHLCTVEVKLASGQRSIFSWPDMDTVNSEVFRNPQRCRLPA